MATIYGSWVTVNGQNMYRPVVVTSQSATDTQSTVSMTVKIEYGAAASAARWNSLLTTSLTISSNLNGTTQSATATASPTPGGTQTLVTRSATITKTHSAQSVTTSATVGTASGSGKPATSSTASGSLSVTAKTHYTVTYNANGSDAYSVPAKQTKWYGESLTLSSTVPIRAGYTFLGWNTNAKGSGTHYNAGASYTANAALTLYAMWLGVSVPSIECKRTNSSGTEADEGTYGTVAASWQASGTVAATVAVTARNVTSSSNITLTGNTSGSVSAGGSASGNVSALFGGGNLSTDTRYKVTVTVTATTTYHGGSTVTKTATAYVPYAYITIDIRKGGHGVAFGKTAVRDGFDVAMSPLYFSQPPTHDTDLTTYNIQSVITATSGNATITYASAQRWGKVAQLSLSWTNASAITVPASGNISNLSVGTIAAGLRPAIRTAAYSHGDGAGAAWYSISSQGEVELCAMDGTGSSRTIAAGTTFCLLCTYILP